LHAADVKDEAGPRVPVLSLTAEDSRHRRPPARRP